MTPEWHVSVLSPGPGVAYVRLDGDIDLDSISDIQTVSGRLLDLQSEAVIIDMGQVEFLSLAAATTLLALKRRIERNGGVVELEPLSRAAAFTLDLLQGLPAPRQR